nr:hypothetical protein [Tanacetum cinerariifolium]
VTVASKLLSDTMHEVKHEIRKESSKEMAEMRAKLRTSYRPLSIFPTIPLPLMYSGIEKPLFIIFLPVTDGSYLFFIPNIKFRMIAPSLKEVFDRFSPTFWRRSYHTKFDVGMKKR